PIAALYVGRALRYHQSWQEAAGQEMAQLWTCSGLNCLFDGGFYLDGLQAGSIPAAAQRLDQANGGHQALAQNLGRQALCIQQRLLRVDYVEVRDQAACIAIVGNLQRAL